MDNKYFDTISGSLKDIHEFKIRQAELGKYLKSLRENFYDSQVEFAQSLDTDRTKFSNYETGKSLPSIGYLAYLLQIQIDALELSDQVLDAVHQKLLGEVNTVIDLVYNHRSRAKHLHLRKFGSWNQASKAADAWKAELQKEKGPKRRNEVIVESTSDNLPLHLRAGTDPFFDREVELEAAVQFLVPGSALVLCGPAGMGKTALAAAAIQKILQEDPTRFPDRFYYYNFTNEPKLYSIDTALRSIAEHYGIEVNENRPPRDAARQALYGKNLVLFLDGTEVCNDLIKLLDVLGDCSLLLTTQRQHDAEVVKAKSIFIDFLPDNYPELLLCSLAGDVIIDQDTATEICDLVGRMTLAVYLIGQALALKHLSTADFLDSLRQDPVEVLNISRFLDGCIKPLSVESWQVLSLMGVLAPAAIEWQALMAGLDIKQSTLAVRLIELVDFGWVVTGEQSCQIRHILLHDFLASKTEDVEPEWISRLGTYYLKHLQKIGTHTKSESFSLDESWVHVLSVLDACKKIQDWECVKGLALAVDMYLDQRGHWEARVQTLKAGLEAVGIIGEHRDEAFLLQGLGVAYHKLGDWSEARRNLKLSLQIYQEIDDQYGQAEALHYLGGTTRLLGELDRALSIHNQALTLLQNLNDLAGQAQALNDLATVYHDQDDWEESEQYFQQSLEIYRDLGDRHSEGKIRSNLCGLCRLVGRHTDAIQHGKEALRLFQEYKDQYGEIKALNNLGNVYDEQGQHILAIEMYQASRRLSDEIGYRRGKSIATGGLALAYTSQCRWEEAITHYLEDIDLCRKLGDRAGERMNLSNLADVYVDQGNWNEARELYDQSLAIARETNSRFGEARTLNNVGILYYRQGRIADAIELYEKSLQLKRTLNDQWGEGHTLCHLAIAYAETGRMEEANALLLDSLAIADSLSDSHSKAQVIQNFGKIHSIQQNWPEASERYIEAVQMYRRLGDIYREGQCHMGLGIVYYHQDDFSAAEEKYTENITVFRQLGAQHDVGLTLMQLGVLYKRQENRIECIETLSKAVEALNSDSVEYQVAGWLLLTELLEHLSDALPNIEL